MRQYEAVYIMDPQLEEAQHDALVARFSTLVQDNGGEIQHVDRWERRRMAYEIKGRREGFYVVMNFRGTQATEAELLRRAQSGETSTFYQHCGECGSRQKWTLVAETPTQEIYKCTGCGQHKVYVVR